MYCRHCGKELVRGAPFCAFCGDATESQKDSKLTILKTSVDVENLPPGEYRIIFWQPRIGS